MGHLEKPETLSSSARLSLLELARSTIAARLEIGEPNCSAPDDPALLERRGAFVTLKIDGLLRGCIGHVIGVASLWSTVEENAVAAAFRDPRFDPLTVDEFARVHIEISALSQLSRCSPDEVVIGRHGVVVEQGGARGLLLPQVAVEYGWEVPTFLDHTCRKAGLGAGAWRDPETALFAFSAEVFGED